MKILLISANVAISPYPVYPVGMSMVAASLKEAGHEVELFDFLQHGQSYERVKEKVEAVQPGIVGISIRNVDNVNAAHEERYIDAVAKMVESIRTVSSSPVILGGSGFSVMPEAVLDKVGADYGIVGEGEQLMRSFVEAVGKGELPEERILRAPLQMEDRAIPSAYYDPVLMEFYQNNGKMISIQTKRGCNKNCIYCSYPVLEGHRLRARDPKAVVDDIEYLIKERAAEYIFFVDSVFNDSDGHYRDVVGEMHRRKINIKWTAFFTPGGDLDDEIMALMKATGLHAAEVGADASTDATLKGLAKDFRWEEVVECNDLFARHEVTTAHYYMFGGPGETRETVKEGIENIRALKHTANFMFMGIRILPNTALMTLAEREGLLTPGQDILESAYYFSPHIDRDWLEKTLIDGFADRTNCVFPPDALDDKLRFLHKMGFSGSAYEVLISSGGK
jgi:lipid biosynthesis B12-binding/radical SAM protein